MKHIGKLLLLGLALMVLAIGPPLAQAGTSIVYSNQPNAIDTSLISKHGVNGPILADDYIPTAGGTVNHVEWWGAPIAAGDNYWEIALHTDAPGSPNIDNGTNGAMVKYTGAANILDTVFLPSDPSQLNPIVHYSMDVDSTNLLTGTEMNVFAGMSYWATIANGSDPLWWWAIAGNPDIGAEIYAAEVSVGAVPCPDGGPHCGPWSGALAATGAPVDNLAFRIGTVPEPTSMILLGTGLAALARSIRRKK